MATETTGTMMIRDFMRLIGFRRADANIEFDIQPERPEAVPETAGAIHAHQLTPDDAAIIRMLAGASFEPNSSVTLPSGRTVTGTEMNRWLESQT